MAKISAKREIEESITYLEKLISAGGTACFDGPIVTSSCPNFDKATANYIRDERVRLYVQSWILPHLKNALESLAKRK